MIVISNSSPLIALARVDHLFILESLFDQIYIPDSVFQEAVLQSNVEIQTKNILQAIDNYIFIVKPRTVYQFKRKLDFGERGVINLAIDKQANFLLMDDKKARKEAQELGFKTLKTSILLKRAEKLGVIKSYSDIIEELEKIKIYLAT
jgi:predicted nucleic acid-binding protein